MAEARVEDEEERMREAREAGGARRNARAPNAAPDRADRNKPEQRQSSSQGALSSIRAAIKRTSNRAGPPADQNRERRRPEITILAAERLPTNSWFPGASGPFPPPPPPAQPSWTGPVTIQLPPPSYEQVIREKSREQKSQTSSVSSSSSSSTSSPSSALSSSSSSAPRHTTTIATQTDPETSEPENCSRPQMRRPPKPPRPSLPLTPKPAEPVLAHTHSLIELDEPSSSTHTPTHPPSGEQCGVQTDFTHFLESLTPITPDSSNTTRNSQQQAPSEQEGSARPRPRPRSKALPQPVIKEEPITREVKVQTLVRLKDDSTGSIFAGFTDSSSDIASNKYLQDLLDVFGCDKQDVRSDQRDKRDQSEKSEEGQSVASESCSLSTVSEPLETMRPEPRPRTQNPKTPAKPSNPKQNVDQTKNPSEVQNKPGFHPVPAPRPLVKKSSASQQQGSSEEKPELCRIRPPPRPPLAARMSRAPTQEEAAQPAEVPFNPSGRGSLEDHDSTADSSGKLGAITSSNRAGGKCSAKPQSQKRPPPLTHTPVHTPAQDAVSAASVSKSGPSLPHRGSEGRLLPLRPPPVKSSKSAGVSLTPATSKQPTGYWGLKQGPPLPPRPKPGHPLYKPNISKIPQAKTKVNLPSRDREETCLQIEKLLVDLDDMVAPKSTPGGVKGHLQDFVSEEPISQKSPELKKEPQMEEQHQPEANTTSVRYRTRFAFEGEDGELTLRDGDVVTLIEYVNDEWGRGSLNGHTGLFPLNFVQIVEESPEKISTSEAHAPTVCVGEGQIGRALYDFAPESEDELCLKAGDVVSSLEEVDEEWFVGEFAGRRGIVPKNYIQVL
ncbi:uncharacterized protein Hap1MRO34_023952 [Clarias gariepinus]